MNLFLIFFSDVLFSFIKGAITEKVGICTLFFCTVSYFPFFLSMEFYGSQKNRQLLPILIFRTTWKCKKFASKIATAKCMYIYHDANLRRLHLPTPPHPTQQMFLCFKYMGRYGHRTGCGWGLAPRSSYYNYNKVSHHKRTRWRWICLREMSPAFD